MLSLEQRDRGISKFDLEEYAVDFELQSAVSPLPAIPRSHRRHFLPKLRYPKRLGGGCLRKVFNFLMNLSTSQLFAFNMIPILGYCCLYGTVVWAAPMGCCGHSNHTWTDSFNFVFQTWTTIGYGSLAPVGGFANSMVIITMWSSIIWNTLICGLIFRSFNRTTISTQISEVMTVCNIDGMPYLQVRLANPFQSDYPLVNCHLKLQVRIFPNNRHPSTHTLALAVDWLPVVEGVFTAQHLISGSSFLFAKDINYLANVRAKFTFSIFGTDAATSDLVHSIATFDYSDVLYGYDFHCRTIADDHECDMEFFSVVGAASVWYPKEPSQLPTNSSEKSEQLLGGQLRNVSINP